MRAIIRSAPVPMEPPRPPQALERWVAGVLGLAALFLVWREVEPLVLFRPADGVVLSSGIVEARRYSGRGRSRSFPVGRVFYRYDIGGEPYVNFQYRRTSLFGAVELASQHKPHDRVRVWYNPLNRAEAVISRDPEWLLLVPCVLLLMIWLRMEREARSRDERAGTAG